VNQPPPRPIALSDTLGAVFKTKFGE
jgi:hypothetical protein